MDELFKGRHFDREIIVLCVRWYLRYKLSFRDLVEMMAERGLSLAHTTIMRWIQHYAPEFEKRWNRFARPAGRSWRVDETYVKIKGRWTYLYRAVDKEGRTVDFLLRAKRDVAAAKAFFRLAFRRQGRLPLKITLDGYQASHRAAKEALDEHPEGNQCKIRSSKYLNNLIEQDHRSVKLRLGPMLGLEPLRVDRRLQLLRRWSHDKQDDQQVLFRGPRPRGANGFGSRRRACLALGGGLVDRRQDRLHGADAA
jgi:transposase-like protein